MLTSHEVVQDRALKALYRDSHRDSVTQQIKPTSVANWYLVRCAPGRDLTAMRWLSRRRFGVFLPLAGIRRVLPGWLAVYAFDIDEMQARIMEVPGVVGILRGHDLRPFEIKDGFIKSLRELVWIGDQLPPARPKAKKSKKPRVVGRDRNKLSKLKRAMKQADRAGELARAVDIRAQITALRQKFYRLAAAA